MRKILLLGASGSIGSQSLDILRRDRQSFLLTGFSVGFHVEKIPEILKDFPSVTSICVRKEEDYDSLITQYPNIHFYWGDEGLREICEEGDYDMAVNALVGFSGLVPSIFSTPKVGAIDGLALVPVTPISPSFAAISVQ